ncbi:unnamed protein product [Discosporangium mesarthrocarpum]
MRLPSSGGVFDCYSPLARNSWNNASGSVGLVGWVQATWSAAPAYPLSSRGDCLDNMEMVSGIHESTVQACFHTFCKNFAKGVYKTWISAPEGEDLQEVTPTYARLGFPCAVGSCDVTHVRWDKAPASHTVYYTGKEGFPSIAYQVTVDHFGGFEAERVHREGVLPYRRRWLPPVEVPDVPPEVRTYCG